jgi:uncharacterized flavoprotein (TIGR03862 family)
MQRLAVIGGGPAGLMAAEVARAAGIAVDVYEGKGSVGRKFLIAGKGGLNLTHSEDYATFVTRYGARQGEVAAWLASFNSDDVRAWARDFGIETFVGTSGRVFPADLKAAPLLRAWVRRLREQGVRFHVHHYCIGIDVDRTMQFQTPNGTENVNANAIVLAMGGGSWPELGSDGRWVEWLQSRKVDVTPLLPANCGFDVAWSRVIAERYAGHPVKSVAVSARDAHGDLLRLQGEFVVTATGVEGSVIYALSSYLRDVIARDGSVEIQLDLAPDVSLERLQAKLKPLRKGRSLTEHLRRSVGIEGVKVGLIYERIAKPDLADMDKLAAAIKALPITLLRPRPLAEAISSAGGVRFAALDARLMLKSMPGIFCAGEMLDWEAPTGGYLLTACFASGRVAAQGAVEWLKGH